MRMSRERIFHLTDLIMKELEASPAVQVKKHEDLRLEIMRALTEESKLEETVDTEVRTILSSYSRNLPEGGREWEVLYQKTREEVFKRRFRL
jgi:hypothetical protein